MSAAPKIPVPTRDRTTIPDLLLGLLAAVVVALFFSSSLDDHDSCLFVAGVERFNVAEHRPHPPGYPFYILAGKLLGGIAGDAASALRLLSILGTFVAATLLPRLFRLLGSETPAAFLKSLVVVACPVFLLTGAKILTDMPGLAFTLLIWVYGLRSPPETARAAFTRGAFIGLAMGWRPHVAIPLIPLLLRRHAFFQLLGVAAGALLWFGGMVAVLGANSVFGATGDQILMRFHEPNISLFVGDGLAKRLARFAICSTEGIFGLEPWKLLAPLLFVGVGWRVLHLIRHDFAVAPDSTLPMKGARALPNPQSTTDASRATRDLLLGSLLQVVFVFLFLPAHPRYFLCVLPALALLIPARLHIVHAAAITLLLAAALPRLVLLHTTLPPPIEAIMAMDAKDPARRIPLDSSKLMAYCRALAPERCQHPREDDAHPPTPSAPFFTDRSDVPDTLPGYHVTMALTLHRDPVVHDKEATVALRLFEPK